MHDGVDDAELGTLTEEPGDHWALTFVRHLPHPQDRVWQAVTEPAHLAAWFPQQMVGERRAGAPLRFESSVGDSFEGEMLAYEPPSVLEFTWGGDRLRIELRPEGDGTLLTLTDTFDQVGKAARDAAGWHECLDRLAAVLATDRIPPWGERWRLAHPRYVDRFGPTASAIGPPEGWEEALRDRA
jgi:uncharacterized protein YndB with AHSA1/START domain